jgi:hypothetical protein
MLSTLGKVLVLIHGALSLTVLAWALGVSTHRVDFNNPPGGGKEAAQGIFARQQAQAEEYKAGADRALNRWSSNLNQVLVLEGERYPRRTFYATHLYMIQTGELGGQKIANPVQQMPLAPNGFLAVPMVDGKLNVAEAINRPPVEVRPGIPAWSIAQYDLAMAKQVDDIKDLQRRSVEAIAERDKLNREIVGVDKPTLVKGLRTLINEQRLISDQAELEERYARVFVTNRESEFGLFKKRRDAMLARVEELKAAAR